jgi:hypothetical protein
MKGLLWTGLLALAPLALSAQQQPPPPTIKVDGTATVEREPERAVLVLAVETESPMAREAARANADAMARVTAELRRAAVPPAMIRTLSYRLDPVYAPPREGVEPRIAGYRAVNMLQVTIDSIPRVGAIIDAAISAGANRVAGLSFELRDPEQARLAALELAMARARREAEAVARAAGRTLGAPIEIQIGGAPVFPRAFAAERIAMAEAVTPVEGGTLTVSASVHVVFRLVRE